MTLKDSEKKGSGRVPFTSIIFLLPLNSDSMDFQLLLLFTLCLHHTKTDCKSLCRCSMLVLCTRTCTFFFYSFIIHLDRKSQLCLLFFVNKASSISINYFHFIRPTTTLLLTAKGLIIIRRRSFCCTHFF